MRPEVKDVILKYCNIGNAMRALNSDERWYTSGQIAENVRIRGPTDYKDTVTRGRTLYATLNLFHPQVFAQEEKWLDAKNAPEMPIGTNANTLAFTFSVDIDGIGDIKNLGVKEAVECAAQFFVDYLAENGIETSVYCLFSGGGIYVHLHHGLFEIPDYSDPEQTATEFTRLGKAFNLLIAEVSREFFRQYGEHIGRVKFDKLNNQKRTFKTIFSIHKRLPYAVIPLDPKAIKIEFSKASLPLGDDVIEAGRAWYTAFDHTEKNALLELLKPMLTEAKENERTTSCSSDTISRKPEPIPRENFPPCIKNIIHTAKDVEGRHKVLGVLATYLYQAGWEEDAAFDLWEEVADRCGVEARIFQTEWGRVCCPNCETMTKNTGSYPSLNLYGLDMCCSDLGCLKAHWPGEYDSEAMVPLRDKRTFLPTKYRNNRGNVERLVELHGHDLRYIIEYDEWVHWNGVKWQISTTAVDEALDDVIAALYKVAMMTESDEERTRTAKFAAECGNNAVYVATKSLASRNKNFAVSILDFDMKEYELNMQNGVLDLEKLAMRRHSHLDRFLKCVSYDYDPAAKCDRWIAFLNEIYAGDQTLIAYMQRIIGRALTGSNSDKAFFILYGPEGDNGKSIILEVLRKLLGEYSWNADFSTFLRARGDKGVRDDLVPFHGVRLITSSEPEEGMKFEIGLIKQITGGDPITCRKLYGEMFSFKPTCKLFFGANNLPAIAERTDAAWSRVHLLPHDVKIPKEKQDQNLGKKLKDEISGILNWALEGLKSYNEIGNLGQPDKCKLAVQSYRVENDTVRQFIDDVCTQGPTAKCSASGIYNSYKAFCHDTGKKPLGLVKFTTAMKDALILTGVTHVREETGKVWRGITAPVSLLNVGRY
ncbi:MAG: phage/plasmid primase, P4 family [Methanothrix sp.]